MRTLTIKRNKTSVAFLAKLKVYIEDSIQNELEISGVPCRKLGELKNGEEKTFQIGDNAAKVFVISDKLSRNYSNDYYPLPAGTEPVYLTGKNCYDLRAGHPFRFDGVTDEAVLANRKKGNNMGTLVMIAALVVGLAVGFVSSFLNQESNAPKDFSVYGMTITLTEAFDEESFEGFTQCYESRDIAVFALREPFTMMDGMKNYSLERYGTMVMQANGITGEGLQTQGDFAYFTYTSEGGDSETYYYFATVHKGTNAFWLIQFAVEQDMAQEYEDEFLQWADSVTFE